MTRTEIVTRFLLTLGLLVVSILCVIKAQDFETLSMYAPTFAGSLLGVFLLIGGSREVVRYVRAGRGHDGGYSRSVEHMSEEPFGWAELRHAVRYVVWIALYVVAMDLLGMYVTAGLFIALFLFFEARRSVLFVAISIAAILLVLWFFGHYVELIWPKGSLTGV